MQKTSINWQAIAIILLGIAGMGIAGYLVGKQLSGTEIGTCPVFGTGCNDVLKSEYSTILGIPLSYLGMFFYTLMTILGSVWLATKKPILQTLIALLALIGFVDSAGFIYIQAVLIGSFCFYCVLSAITATLMFFVMLPTIIDRILAWKEKRGQ